MTKNQVDFFRQRYEKAKVGPIEEGLIFLYQISAQRPRWSDMIVFRLLQEISF